MRSAMTSEWWWGVWWREAPCRWLGCGVDAAVVAVDAVVEEAADEDGEEDATVAVEAELADDPCPWMPCPWFASPVWLFDCADPANEEEVEFPVALLPPLIGGSRLLLIPALLLRLLFVFEVHLKRL